MDKDERSCGQEKGVYEQCFDKWYTEVFLQHKADGNMGCQDEYKAYMRCFMNKLQKLDTLTESIKSTMQPDVRERFEAQMEEARCRGKQQYSE